MYGIGFNCFGQIDCKKRSEIIVEPEKIELNIPRIRAKRVLCVTWNTLILSNDDGSVFVKGFFDGEDYQERLLKFNRSELNAVVRGVCYFRNRYYCIKEGKLVILEQGDKLVEISSHEDKLLNIKFTNLDCDLSAIYGLTDSLELYQITPETNHVETFLLPFHRIKSISCGFSHCLSLSEEGLLFSWGSGSRGQLGHGDLLDVKQPKLIDLLCGVTMSAVSAGGWHSAALGATGDIYMWGWNESGQLGFPPVVDTSPSYQKHKTDLNKDDVSHPRMTMLNTPSLLELEPYLKCECFVTICSISCGSRHTAAVTDGGLAVTWGWAKYGQLGQECCTSFWAGRKEHGSDSKRRKLENGCDICSDKFHSPGFVEHFLRNSIFISEVKCSNWSTFFITKNL